MKLTKENILMGGMVITMVGMLYANLIWMIDRNFDILSGLSSRIADVENKK